ncbi:CBS domain-containing protein [Pseudaestuariivita atlantica]|jgi:CBS-domain-containing membrane protein|uniref:Cystathionine beta-lyase n=1 Tax=Pseudaestuariivita atlantica TaxID=1317121 RepID=A0A0L1JKL2_9RHOB|nr:CBS domain-containing protein [Pseudaestuariivita atlantica]KNG91923.1 cystathionine beta-lyase [Pseudaestuariivita atlantica]MDP7151553.1 CBS domain-containing protein [Paracoccaceae bacterium]MDP7187171.1 CBS domain-containing protein [Paracoccaceae bacterium]
MKAKDIMKTAVVSIRDDGTVEQAVNLMLENHISALPVLDSDNRLVGLISEGDLIRRLRDGGAERRSWWLEMFSGEGDARDYVKARSHRVADVMTRDLVTVDEGTLLSEIARTLETRRIKRVPVLRDGNMVGIVSRADLVRALAQSTAGKLPSPAPEDEPLRRSVEAAIAEVPGASVNLINLIVENGNVAIWGIADSDFVENAIRVAAENVDGVRSVDVRMGRLPAWAYGI